MGKKIINPLLEVKNKTMNLINPYTFGNPLRNNLIAEWKFEGNANDTSGKGHNGIVSNPGPSLVTGKVGQCYSFPGIGNYNITIPDAADLSFTNGSGTDKPFSVCLWVKPTVNGDHFYLNKRSSAIYHEWELIHYLSTFQFVMFDAVANTYLLSTIPYTNFGSWVFVCGTYSGNNNESGLTLSINGVIPTNTRSHNGTYIGMSNTSAPVYIGSLYGGGTAPLNGLIDEVRIFNKELSLAEINQVMNWS